MNNKYKKFIIIFLLTIILFQFFGKDVGVGKSERYTDEQREKLIRFGITAPLGVVGYDLSTIHALTYLDWAKESSTVPAGVEYIHVLKMRFVKVRYDGTGVLDEAAYQQFLLELPSLVSRNPGGTWLIGNEPDRKVVQDDLTPEKYAERFYDVSKTIKDTDSNAKVGFGSIVQPTPIRLRYLDRSLNKLAEKAGSMEEALALIDIWAIHAFILNENPKPGSWGADVPPGFDCPLNCEDAYIINDYNYSETYSIDIFKERVLEFREWMHSKGQEDKPLWITEYGSLFPDWEVALCYYHQDNCIPRSSPNEEWPTSSDNIQYMLDTFDFLMNSTDDTHGMPNDNNKLVQRWYWYSLNGYVKIIDDRASYGGSLFDPENNKEMTKQGIAYKNYIELLIGPKIYLPILLKNNFIIQ